MDDDVVRVAQVIVTQELEGFLSVGTPKLPHSVAREQLSVLQEFAIGVYEDCCFRGLVTDWSLFLCDWL